MYIDIKKLHLIKFDSLVCGFEQNNNSGYYEFNLKENKCYHRIYYHNENQVHITFNLIPFAHKLTSDEQFYLHKKYPKVKRIKKSLTEYVQKYALIKIRDKKLRKLLNE